MSYLLDTSAVSDYFKQVGATYERFQARPPYALASSPLTEPKMRAVRARAERLPPGRRGAAVRRPDAAATTEVRAALQGGESIGDLDVLIAGVALARDTVLVNYRRRASRRLMLALSPL